jgi:RNA polymerase sigma-70 factor (ECF subfamily)
MSQGLSALLLTRLVDEYYSLLYRYAYRLSGSSAEAEDLTQQTYLAAAVKLDQLRDLAHAKAWLFTILRNLFLKRMRREAVVCWVSLDEVGDSFGDDVPDFEIDSEQLQHALNELPEEYRSPLILYYFEEFTYHEIAEHLGIALGTVMSRLSRGKTFLRRRLEKRVAEPAG